MKARVEMLAGCTDGHTLESLASVLAPDNEGAPRGMRLTSASRGRTLSIIIESDSASSSISTALAILKDMRLFDEVWLLSRQRGPPVGAETAR